MFSIDFEKGDISLARRSMLPKATSSGSVGKSSSNNDVIDLVSDGDDDAVQVGEVNSDAANECIMVVPRDQKDRDINDNTGFTSGGEANIEKKTASLFERRSYQRDRYVPGKQSEISAPDASFSRLSIYKRQSITTSPERRSPVGMSPASPSKTRHGEKVMVVDLPSPAASGSATATSGIIINRAYKKTPATGTSNVDRLVLVSPSDLPVVCVDDIEGRLSLSSNGFTRAWHNRYDGNRAASAMSNPARSNTPRSSFLRRSFHKPTSSPKKMITIDLEQDSLLTVAAGGSSSRSSGCSNSRILAKQRDPTPPRTLSTREVRGLAAGRTASHGNTMQEGMDISEVDEACVQHDLTEDSTSPSSSGNVENADVEVNLIQKLADTTQASAEVKVTYNLTVSSKSTDDKEEVASDQGSSMGNTYGDVSSSGCLNKTPTGQSAGRRQGVLIGAGGRQPLNEFDLMLLKINQTVPPMSQKDRIDKWRVTAEDLLHSIPTKAEIETSSTNAKRTLDDIMHISSDEDSDNLDCIGEPCTSNGQRTNKKRRKNEDEREQMDSQSRAPKATSESTLAIGDRKADDDASGLDFRKSQINPEIDKSVRPPAVAQSMILVRKNYYKLPTRYGACSGTHSCERSNFREIDNRPCGCTPVESSFSCPSLAGQDAMGKPYALLLSRDEERDKFLSYLQISPFFRTDEKALGTGKTEATNKRSNADSPMDQNQSPNVGAAEMPMVNSGAKANPLQSCQTKQPKQGQKEKRKKPPKSKTHPSVFASSGRRGVRRLVLSSSLRSGKVIRYKNNILNLSTHAKPKLRLSKASMNQPVTAPMKAQDNGIVGPQLISQEKAQKFVAAVVRSHRLVDAASSAKLADNVLEGESKRHHRRQCRRESTVTAVSPLHPLSPVPSSSASVGKKSSKERCSVDSAVSSSTSAEMRHDETRRTKECQTVSTIPPLVDVIIEQKQPLPPSPLVNEGKRLRNPLARADGEVLHVFLINEQLIVVQKELISFWRYSRLSVLLGVKQDWQRVAQIQRWNRDTEVDTNNSNRVVFNQPDPVYLEPRARDLNEDKSRACPLASIYVNAYFLDTSCSVPIISTRSCGNADPVTETGCAAEKEDASSPNAELLRMKSYQLDTVKSALEDIRLLPLADSRDFIVCWHEHVTDMESRTAVCKYSLTPDLETLSCIREFAIVQQRLRTLKCINDRKLLGLGHSTVHIWCFESGYLLRTVDLKIEIGLIMCAFLHIDADESTLIMLQLQQPSEATSNNRKLMKVIAVNLYKPTWYTVHSYEIALASMSITGESPVWCMNEANVTHQHCVTFDSGELLLVSLADPTACWTNHQRLEKDLQRAETGSVNICSRLRSNGSTDLYRPRERILNGCNWNGGRDLVFLSEQCLITKTIDEYITERIKDK